MQLSDFDYTLPEQLIARYPAEKRSQSRLMVVDREKKSWHHHYFHQLETFLRPSDLLIFNNTKVIPARLLGHKETGGKVELLVERSLDEFECLAHIKSSKSTKEGAQLTLEGGFRALVLGRENSLFILRFEKPLLFVLEQVGHVPLPPYIDRADQLEDQSRYQTVYACSPGAVAAPTAGLHFDLDLIQQLENQGIDSAFVTLHVGSGTFQPVRDENVQQHKMHSEWYELPELTCQKILKTKEQGGRVIAVGTTSVRTLESAFRKAQNNSTGLGRNHEAQSLKPLLQAAQGETDIFIYPGYQFGVVDAMITNFHLPKSTLLMLVSAFMGRELMLDAYQAAIEAQYRFFSYGDAMFLATQHS